jgi:hypothetical protein
LFKRGLDTPHHRLAHDIMMVETDAQDRLAIIDTRIERERPRPEVQPIGKS